MMKVRMTEFTREYVVKEFELTQEVLDEWQSCLTKVTMEDVVNFTKDPTSVSDEIHDVLHEMFDDIEYDIYDEDTHDDGVEYYIVESES